MPFRLPRTRRSRVEITRATPSDTRPAEGSILARLLPHFRSTKFTFLAIGGVLCVATAATATAATWPSASAAPSRAAVQQAAAGLAASGLTAGSGQADGAGGAYAVAARAAGGSFSVATEVLEFQRVRYGIGTRVAAIEAAQARAAAARERAAHAAHIAHQQHAAAVARAAAAARAAARQAAANRAAAQQQATQAAAQPTATPQAASVPTGSPQQIAEGMLAQFGWSSDQFSCLDPLWEHESGWNPSAENPSTGAYGIPQALPGSKMASAGSDWATNPATQIQWGLDYIQSTYGSPCSAWSHEESTGWY